MNVKSYRRFLEAIGHQVIASVSGYWFDASWRFYKSIPPFRVITPSQAEVHDLFSRHQVLGLKYCAPPHHIGKLSAIYICRDKGYDFKNLHRKMRNKVRQGLRNCTVRPITFEYLYYHGMPLNRDTLKRQDRDDPTFSQQERWERFCRAGQEAEGAGVWGAFVGEQLAAYMVTFVINGCSNILYQMSRTDLLNSRANNALAFVATREMLASPDIRCVSYGQESIRVLPGLDEYKLRLGYEKWPMRHVVVLHPLLRVFLLSQAGKALLGGLSRLFPSWDALKLVRGIVDIARQSPPSGQENIPRRGGASAQEKRPSY